MLEIYVCVCDDEVFNLIANVLRTESTAVLHAATGATALRLLSKRRRPTVVILDLPLADMSGSEFVESLSDDGELSAMVATVCLAGGSTRLPERAFRIVPKPSPARVLVDAVSDGKRKLERWRDGTHETALDRYFEIDQPGLLMRSTSARRSANSSDLRTTGRSPSNGR
jgi:CheY-like chemotaxis protein